MVLSGRLRRFVEAYDDDPTVLGKLAIGQILADLWDANTFLKPIWIAVRRLAKRIDDKDRRAAGKAAKALEAGDDGEDIEADLAAIADLDALVPIMDQLGRWHKRTTGVALRLAEIHLRITGGGGNDYLEDKYGADEPGPPGGARVAPHAVDAEVVDGAVAEPGESAHGPTSADGEDEGEPEGEPEEGPAGGEE